MSVVTRWLAGRLARAAKPTGYVYDRQPPLVAADLGTVQPIVGEIESQTAGRAAVRSVGLVLERGNVSVELRILDPEALRTELDEAIAWQNGGAS